jgi:hypothetical protein
LISAVLTLEIRKKAYTGSETGLKRRLEGGKVKACGVDVGKEGALPL